MTIQWFGVIVFSLMCGTLFIITFSMKGKNPKTSWLTTFMLLILFGFFPMFELTTLNIGSIRADGAGDVYCASVRGSVAYESLVLDKYGADGKHLWTKWVPMKSEYWEDQDVVIE